MKKLILTALIALFLTFALADAAIVKNDNGEPGGNSYKSEYKLWEESTVIVPDGPCDIDSILIYYSGEVAAKDTIWVVGFPTSGNLWPTQYVWEINKRIDPIEIDYDGNEGWLAIDVSETGLRSEGLDKIVIQHRLKPDGPWFTYDSDGRNSGELSWLTDPYTPNPNFLDIRGTIFRYPVGDYMIRLAVDYDFPDGNTSEGPPPPTLVNVSDETGFEGGGYTSVVDWNNDGWDDLESGGNYLENNKDGSFTNVTSEMALPENNTTWGDINNDGNIDVFFSRGWGNDKIYLNNGDRNFEEITEQTTIINDHSIMTPMWLDYDDDGLLDLFIANNRSGSYPNEIFYPDQLWKQNPDGSFTNVREESGIAAGEPAPYFDCYGASASDYNDDNKVDIFVANYRLAKDNLYKNNGDGTFDEVAEETGVQGNPTADPDAFGHGMGAQWGDFNNDGYMDLCVGNLAHTDYRGIFSNPSLIFKNNGPPDYDFEEVRQEMGLKFYEGNAGVLWLDLNLDGYLDLWHGLYSGGVNHIYLNEGPPDFHLKEITWLCGAIVNRPWTASSLDYDRDGDLDIVIRGKLYRNDMEREGKWLAFRLEGSPEDDVNMDAYGSRIIVYAEGKQFTRELMSSAAGSKCSQNSSELHFGLGDLSSLDSVVVIYPNEERNIITDIDLNARYRIPYMETPVQNGLATPALKYPKTYQNKIPTNPLLQWHKSTGTALYIVQVSESPNFPEANTTEYQSVEEEKQIEGLEEHKTYYWRVNAMAGTDTTIWSSVWAFSVGLPLPSQPILIEPLADTSDVSALPKFTWSSVEYDCEYGYKNSYKLQISTDESFSTPSEIIEHSNIKDTVFKLSESLEPGTQYYWLVKALNEDAPGEWSEIRSFSTLALPAQPALVEPENNAAEVNQKPRFKWEEDENAYYYHLQVAKSDSFDEMYMENENLTFGSYRNIAKIFDPETKFYWRVKAGNDGGETEWSEVWSFTTAGDIGVEDILKQSNNIEIFPSPAFEIAKAKIASENKKPIEVWILTTNGKTIEKAYEGYLKKGKNIIAWDTSKLNSGLYFCKFNIDGFIIVKKLVIIK